MYGKLHVIYLRRKFYIYAHCCEHTTYKSQYSLDFKHTILYFVFCCLRAHIPSHNVVTTSTIKRLVVANHCFAICTTSSLRLYLRSTFFRASLKLSKAHFTSYSLPDRAQHQSRFFFSMRRPGSVAASLPLQMLIYYNQYVIFMYAIIMIIGFIYKSDVLPYPSDLLGWECTAFVMFLIIDVCRLFIGSKGNRTRNVVTTSTFMILTIPVIIGNVFFTQWQVCVGLFGAVLLFLTPSRWWGMNVLQKYPRLCPPLYFFFLLPLPLSLSSDLCSSR